MSEVLVFYQYYCTPKGAWGTRYYEFVKRWVEAGHNVTVVTSIYDKSDLVPTGLVTHFDIEGADIIAINVALSNKHGVGRRVASFVTYAAASSWFAATRKADVVVASSGPLSVGIPGLVAKRLRGRKLIFEVRDLTLDAAVELGVIQNRVVAGAARRFERLCYRSADAVVALSPGMAEGVKRTWSGARTVVIPNAADLELFSPDRPVPDAVARKVAGRFVALYAGTMGRANNGLEIVAIARELKRRGANDILVVIIGDGAERPLMEAEVAEDGLSNVLFLGILPKTEVADWYAAASAVFSGFKPVAVLGTTSPNKLFDGLAAGRAILNNTSGWVHALLEEQGCGMNYPADDAVAAADLLIRLRDEPQLRLRMQERARSLAEERFARDDLSARFEQLLRT